MSFVATLWLARSSCSIISRPAVRRSSHLTMSRQLKALLSARRSVLPHRPHGTFTYRGLSLRMACTSHLRKRSCVAPAPHVWLLSTHVWLHQHMCGSINTCVAPSPHVWLHHHMCGSINTCVAPSPHVWLWHHHMCGSINTCVAPSTHVWLHQHMCGSLHYEPSYRHIVGGQGQGLVSVGITSTRKSCC